MKYIIFLFLYTIFYNDLVGATSTAIIEGNGSMSWLLIVVVVFIIISLIFVGFLYERLTNIFRNVEANNKEQIRVIDNLYRSLNSFRDSQKKNIFFYKLPFYLDELKAILLSIIRETHPGINYGLNENSTFFDVARFVNKTVLENPMWKSGVLLKIKTSKELLPNIKRFLIVSDKIVSEIKADDEQQADFLEDGPLGNLSKIFMNIYMTANNSFAKK
ncbi:MAG: hypothetical protein JJV96_02870 [Alphaproteobacteria bacterium]|nr:hypothetical protein [Alphaproteobacteria bacterium]